MLIDLQLHSSYSDGYFTPTEVAKFIKSKGVEIAALTDHNTVAGLDEFRRACRALGIKPITGLEFYVKLGNKRFNLLWFNFDDQNPELHKLLRDSQIRRRGKVRKVLHKLLEQGFKFDINRIVDKYNHYIPLNHIVNDVSNSPANMRKIRQELNNKKPRENEIMDAYFLGERGKRLEESYINIHRIIALRKQIGGQLILNHPGKHNQLRRDLLIKLKDLGIDGIEVLSPHHSYGAVVYAQHIAKELGFIMTGGSDFHVQEDDTHLLRDAWDYYKIDAKYLAGIKKIIG